MDVSISFSLTKSPPWWHKIDIGAGNGGFTHDPVFGAGTFALSRPGFGGNQPSLEEIEAQLLRTAGAQAQVPMQQERKMMSLEEVEAALMNINGGRPIYSEAMIAEQQAKQARIEQRREERLAKQAEIVCQKHTGKKLQANILLHVFNIFLHFLI